MIRRQWTGTLVAVRPVPLPIGLQLARSAKTVERAFDGALGAAGGSLPTWLVLLNLKTRQVANQRELADAVGIREATLTHHLNAMEASGLLTRRRDANNRRIHIVELTLAGEAAFLRLRDAAVAFDLRLQGEIKAGELQRLGVLLERLAANASSTADGEIATGGS